MVILLLLTIAAILLFGAAAVRGVVAGAVLNCGVLALVGLVVTLGIVAYSRYPKTVLWSGGILGGALICLFVWAAAHQSAHKGDRAVLDQMRNGFDPGDPKG